MRAALFIDEANIYFSQKTLKWEVDFEKVYSYFSSHFALYNCFFYAAEPLESEKEKKEEYQQMTLQGYTMRLKRLKEIRDKTGKIVAKKANLDIEMAVDMFATKDNYDIAVVFSGDSDFIRVVELLRTYGKQILIFSTKGHSAIDLINAGDKYVDMKEMKKLFAVEKKKKAPTKQPAKKKSPQQKK